MYRTDTRVINFKVGATVLLLCTVTYQHVVHHASASHTICVIGYNCCYVVQSYVITKICDELAPLLCKPYGTSVQCIKGMVALPDVE